MSPKAEEEFGNIEYRSIVRFLTVLFRPCLWGLVPTYTKKVFDWFRSPNPNKTLTLSLDSNKFVIDNMIGYL